MEYTGFPCIMENLEKVENNKFIFQVVEMSWNFLEKILLVKRNPLKQKCLQINSMPVEENFNCRRKSVPVKSVQI